MIESFELLMKKIAIHSPYLIKTKKGFALIVSLMILSLILLLISLLTSQLQIQIKSSESILLKKKSQLNARLALRCAIGRLQQNSGSDLRVTASSSILQESVFNSNWTGVWNSSSKTVENRWGESIDYGERLDWLVSSNKKPDPRVTIDKTALEIISELESGLGNSVFVEKVPINNDKKELQGNFAWWVGDDGLKARINLYEPSSFNNPETIEHYHQKFSPLKSGASYLLDWRKLTNQNSKLPLVDQLENFKLLKILPAEIAAKYYYDFTTKSLSLLTNNKTGGLLKDLTRILEDNQGPSDEEFLYDTPVHYRQDRFEVGSKKSNEPFNNKLVNLPYILSGHTGFDTNGYGPDTRATWGRVRDFYNQKDVINGRGPKRSIPVQAMFENGHALGPVLNGFVVAEALGLKPNATNDKYSPIAMLKPGLILHNPYNLELEAADYLISWYAGHSWDINNIRSATVVSSEGIRNPLASLNRLKGARYDPSFAKHYRGEAFYFQIKGIQFEAGEVKLLTLSENNPGVLFPTSAGAQYIPGEVLELVEGLSDIHFYLDKTDTLTPAKVWPEIDLNPNTVSTDSITYSFKSFGSSEFDRSDELCLFLGGTPDSPGPLLNAIEEFGGSKEYHNLQVHGPAEIKSGFGKDWIARRLHAKTPSHSWMPTKSLANYNFRSLVCSSDVHWELNDPVSHGISVTDPAKASNFSNLFSVDGKKTMWGASYLHSNWGQTNVPLYELFDQRIVNVGQLMHANLTERCYDPGHALGNSLATPFVAANSEDVSYRLNQEFWDNYFFSSIPFEHNDSDIEDWRLRNKFLENARIKLLNNKNEKQLKNFNTAASALAILGGFNINSTSKEAWISILASLNSTAYYNGNGFISLSAQETVFSKLAIPRKEAQVPNFLEGSIHLDDYYGGAPKKLGKVGSQDFIKDLATEIVSLIRSEGPFMSLSGFINRDLSYSSTHPMNLRGLLQNAILRTNINEEIEMQGSSPYHGRVEEDLDGINLHSLVNPAAHSGPAAEGAPGYLMQADILQQLGAFITARSDTFTIRAYGETVDSVSGKIVASSTCEAVLQRIPEPIIACSNNFLEPDISSKNKIGRRYLMIDFRWIDE